MRKPKLNAAHKAHATRKARLNALLAVVQLAARTRGPVQSKAKAALESFAG